VFNAHQQIKTDNYSVIGSLGTLPPKL